MLKFPPFAPLKSFFAAAESGRLRSAAQQLGLTESAVSHQVKRLEEFLGIALFERHGRELRLTSAGTRFHQVIRPALATLQSATEEMMSGPRRQRVTVTSPTSIAAFWLIPRMAKLQQKHPTIDVQLVATNRVCDLAREQIDIAIRYGAGQWKDVTTREMMQELYFPVASAEFMRKHEGQDPAELLKAGRIIVNAIHPDEWTEWCGAHGMALPRASNMVTLNSAEMLVPALLDGFGIGIGRRPIIDPLLKEGRLVPLFRDRAIRKAGYYLAEPKGATPSPAVRKVAEWLLEEAGASDQQAAVKMPVKTPAKSGAKRAPKKRRG